MKAFKSFFHLFLVCLLMLSCVPITAQDDGADEDKVYLTLLYFNDYQQVRWCHTTKFDKKQIKIDFQFEDTLSILTDLIYEEDPMKGPDCFIPDVKLIYRDYTYIISMYCTSVMKFKNSAAYRTSSVRMRNDLVFTESVYGYLARLKTRYFGRAITNRRLIEDVVSSEKIIPPLEEEGMSQEELEELLFSEDDDDDDEMSDFTPAGGDIPDDVGGPSSDILIEDPNDDIDDEDDDE